MNIRCPNCGNPGTVPADALAKSARCKRCGAAFTVRAALVPPAGAATTRGVFISYSTADKLIADAVCRLVEAHGLACWIAPRDVGAGRVFAEAILDGLREASVMLLIFSERANASNQVLREIERAVHFGKTIVPVRIEECRPTKSLEYFLSVPQWFDAFPGPVEPHLERLAAVLRGMLGAAAVPLAPPPPAAPTGPKPVAYSPVLLADWERRLVEGRLAETLDCRDEVLLHDLRELLRQTLTAHDIDDHSTRGCEVALVELYRNVARHAAAPVANVEVAVSFKYKRFLLAVSSQGPPFALDAALAKYDNLPPAERTVHGLQNLLTRGTLELTHDRGWNTVKFSALLATRPPAAVESLALHLRPSTVKVGNREFGYREWSHLGQGEVVGQLLGQWKAAKPCRLSVLYQPPPWTKNALELEVMASFKRLVAALRADAAFALEADPEVHADPNLWMNTESLLED